MQMRLLAPPERHGTPTTACSTTCQIVVPNTGTYYRTLLKRSCTEPTRWVHALHTWHLAMQPGEQLQRHTGGDAASRHVHAAWLHNQLLGLASG